MRYKIFLSFIILLFISCNYNQPVKDHLQIFRYNESKGIATLDPAFARNQALIWPVHQIYNGLVQLDDSLRVMPCIAKRWTISPDGRVYTFYLRTDVYFQDSEVFKDNQGRRVVASDFVFSFERISDPKTASPGSWVFSPVRQSKGNDGFKALNDSIFQIVLEKPFPAFMGLLSTAYCSVIPYEAIKKFGKDFRSHPVGSGPFYLKYWREGEKLVLRKNPKYFERDENGKKLPNLDAINISFIPDKQSEFLEFIKGNIDFISGVHPASKDELLTRTGELNPKYIDKFKMLTGPYLNTEYLGILIDSTLDIVKNSPLKNILVRKAFGHGIDRNKMMIHLRGNLGFPATSGFVPSGMPNFKSHTKGFDYNPELSKNYLQKAGYPNGIGLPAITISTTDDYVDICEFIQHQLNELGFDIKVEVFPGSAYREMMANSKLLVFRGSWIADYADPENYLALFYSKNWSPAGPNYTHFSSKEYDNLYENAASTQEWNLRSIIYQKMDSMVLANAVVIPLYYDKVVRFVSKDVQGMVANPMNLLDLKRVSKN